MTMWELGSQFSRYFSRSLMVELEFWILYCCDFVILSALALALGGSASLKSLSSICFGPFPFLNRMCAGHVVFLLIWTLFYRA